MGYSTCRDGERTQNPNRLTNSGESEVPTSKKNDEATDPIAEPAAVWEAKASPRKPLGQWLVENVPRGVELELPDRQSNRPIPFVDEPDD